MGETAYGRLKAKIATAVCHDQRVMDDILVAIEVWIDEEAKAEETALYDVRANVPL